MSKDKEAKQVVPSSIAFVEIRDTYKESIKNLNINKVSFGTVFITEIPNPFKLSINKKRTALHGKPLIEYVQTSEYDETNYCIIYNGKLIKEKEEQESIIVQEKDIIVYFPYQEWEAVGYIASAIISYFAATSAIAIALAYVVAFAVVVGGMMLISRMLAPSDPNADANMSNNMTDSKTYSWDGISTNRDVNSPTPVLYGTHVLGGTEINKSQYYENSDDWLSLQIALCYGEIEEINSADIYVNGQPYNSFISDTSDGYFKQVRGTFEQEVMNGFDDTTFNNGNIIRNLDYNEPYIFTTESDNIDSFKLHFSFPNGLYSYSTTNGNYNTYSVNYSIGYRLVGETEWTYIKEPKYQKQYSVFVSYPIYERDATDTYWNSRYISYWTDWKEYNSSTFPISNPTPNMCGTDDTCEYQPIYTEGELQSENRISYRTIFIGDSEVLSYSGNSTSAISFSIEPNVSSIFSNETLQLGQYEVKVTRLSSIPSSIYIKSTMQVSFIEEINTTDINYGGIAQLGLKLKATEHIEGSIPTITTKVTRKDLTLYTNDIYTESITARNNNPAWVCYDILTNPFYGAKIKPSQIDYDRFVEWASFCDLEHIREETIISSDETFSTDRLTYNSSENILKVYKSEIIQEITSIEVSTYNRGLSQITLTKDDGELYSYNGLIDITDSVDVGGEFYLFTFEDYNSDFNDTNITNIYFLLDFASIDFITLTELGHPLQLNFNGTFDTLTNPWDACQKVGKLGRGQILLRGNKYTCVFDGIQTITNMFNVGDIKKESFQISYTPLSDLATELEIQYPDEDIRNELNAVTILDKDLNDTKVTPKTSTVDAVGITTKAEAIVFGRYMLATTKYQRRTVTWESDIKGVTCEVGDIVAIQNDVPLWGNGGRIQEVDTSEVTLEEPVTLTSDKVYVLKIQSQDNTFTDYYIEDTDLTDTYTIPLPNTSDIEVYNSYIFGENNNEALLVRLTEVKRTGKELSTKFTGTDYNPSILDFNYNNDLITSITPSLEVANELLTFNISEDVNISSAGIPNITLTFTWTAITTSTYNIYAIPDFVSEDETPLPNIPDNRIYLGKNVKGSSYISENTGLIENRYRIFIQEIGNPSNFIEQSYTVSGNDILPPDVDIFTISGRPNEVKTLVFDIINKPPDLSGYIIKYQVGDSLNWNTATKIHEGILKTSPYKADITKVQGQYNLLIKAVDVYGNESLNVKYIKFNQGETLIDNLIYEKDYHAEGFIGEIYGGVVQPNNDLLAEASTAYFYYNLDSDIFYDKNNGENFYQGLFEPMYYIGSFIPDGSGTALIEYSGTASQKIEYREYYPLSMYTNDVFNFYGSDSDMMYEESGWNLYTGGFPVQYTRQYEVRVSYIEGTVRPSITALKIIVDVEDIDESLEDINILIGGTTINTKYITNLKNVVATLQSFIGSTATRVEVISKTNTSATLKCFDDLGSEVEGLVDIRLKGYINN